MRPSLFFNYLVASALGLLALSSASSLSASESPAVPRNPAGFVIHRGTNLSHWLSQDFGWAPRLSFITENDIRFIARSGFDHVRLPIDEKELWTADGKPNEDAFGLMLKAVAWCRTHNLRVIIDLHTVNAHHFNAANEGLTNTLWSDPKAQEHFLSLWRDLAARLRSQPVSAVAYEIMNEPVADHHDDWNKLIDSTLKQIRADEPQRVIVIGANMWQIPQNVPALKLPAGDKNIIISMHTYSPMLLTHYTAEWVPLKIFKGAVHYPGPTVSKADYDALMATRNKGITDLVESGRDNWGLERFRKEFEPAVKRAKELGLQLYCGEFGCLPTVPRAARLAYYRDIIGVFETEGIAWANWEYKGDFGLFEWHGVKYQGGAPDVELLDALFLKR